MLGAYSRLETLQGWIIWRGGGEAFVPRGESGGGATCEAWITCEEERFGRGGWEGICKRSVDGNPKCELGLMERVASQSKERNVTLYCLIRDPAEGVGSILELRVDSGFCTLYTYNYLHPPPILYTCLFFVSYTLSHPLPLPPIPHMPPNQPRRLLGAMLPPNSLHKIPLGIHQIKIDTMIDQVILPLLRALGRREIHAIFLTHVFDLFPGAGEADDAGVEFGEVGFEHGGGVAGGVAGDKDGEEGGVGGVRGGEREARVDEVDHAGHFVEFFGADVRAVSEAEVDLGSHKLAYLNCKQTREGPAIAMPHLLLPAPPFPPPIAPGI